MKRTRKAAKRVRETAPAYTVEAAMTLLLDTHVWIWWSTSDRRLGKHARLAIDSAQEVYFSAASAWEIAIKARSGKLPVLKDIDLERVVAASGFLPLPIEMDHAFGVASLADIHGDPFDRLLVSQALVEKLTIVTADAVMARYPVATLDARA